MSRVDVLIIAALPEEFAAARAVGLGHAPGAEWQQHDRDSATPFETIAVAGPAGRPLSFAIARPTWMGGRRIGPLATALAQRLSPRCLAMCGVCAGNPRVVALGDVVVGEPVYEYDEGRRTATDFLSDHRQLSMDERWVRRAQEFSTATLPSYGVPTREQATQWLLETLFVGDEPREHPARARYFPGGTWSTWPAELHAQGLIARNGRGWVLTDEGRDHVERSLYDNVDGPDRLPFVVKVGPMASGSVVVKDGLTWASLSQAGVHSVAALEMEAATLATVARQQGIPHWMVAKGVMDHADADKDDRYKAFAARASAEALFGLLIDLLIADGTEAGPAGAADQQSQRLLEDLARRYDLARGLPAGALRTAEMQTVLSAARAAASTRTWSRDEVRALLAGTDGSRMCALAALHERPYLCDIDLIVELVADSHSGFEQFQGLRLATAIAAGLPPAERERLRKVVQAQMSSTGRIRPDGSRWAVASRLLTVLEDASPGQPAA